MFYLKRKLKKIYQVGPRECWRIVSNRSLIHRFVQKNKQHALQKNAAINWQDFESKYVINCVQFFEQLKKNNLIFLNDYLKDITSNEILNTANNIVQNRWLLFNESIIFKSKDRWHTDFLLKKNDATDCVFDPDMYFNEIQIIAGKSDRHVKDVRVVWELNRLQMLVQLGQAFKLTGDEKFVDYFQELIIDWCNQNAYLLGVNWLCPMEVGIRAINLIIAFDYFKHAHIDNNFWQQYICLLYDHMNYLENTWEYYDGRTSNHYLSDLVGYFYLTWFFGDLHGMQKKQDWVVSEVLKEFEKQIQLDGTSYEGSTSYHVLVTELFYLFYLLCDQLHISLPQSFMQTLAKMFDFIDACNVNTKDMITIGDSDSGKVLYCGLPYRIVQQMKNRLDRHELQHFVDFGLSILKNRTWHVSLRHHVYNNRQPSGHFHNDVGSVTLAIDGIPILVDPGSYCYTASAKWRNFFRSVEQHNVMFFKGTEQADFDERLFALSLPEKKYIHYDDDKILKESHILYDNVGLTLNRELKIEEKALFIYDSLNESSKMNSDLVPVLNFVFSPKIVLQKEQDSWLIMYRNKVLCMLETELKFEQYNGWVSDVYGKKNDAICLRAKVPLTLKEQYVSCFRLPNSIV
ncbi:MAG: heparinase II/III family protein [Candidatus Dependentiae bacterium]